MAQLDLLNHFWLTLLLLLPVILISRAVVAGTKYSPILIIVIFGLSLGLILEVTGIATQGLPEFPVIGLSSGVTVTALIVTFFVGGQKLRNTFYKPKLAKKDDVVLTETAVIIGKNAKHIEHIVRTYLI